MRSRGLPWAALGGLAAGWIVACASSRGPPPGTAQDATPIPTSSPSAPPSEAVDRDAGARPSNVREPPSEARDRDAGTDAGRTTDGGRATANDPPRAPRDGGIEAGAPVPVDAAPTGSAETPPLRYDSLRTPPKVKPVFPDAGENPL